MKIYSLLASVVCVASIVACSDEFSQIGSSIDSPDNQVIVYSDTMQITSKTANIEKIYIYTQNELLGEFADGRYGKLTTDFLTQFYPALEMDMGENGPDSMELHMQYLSYIGDSLAPMHLSVYQIDKAQLPAQPFSNINPAEYSSREIVLGQKGYIASDMNVADSIKENEEYVPDVVVKLSQTTVDKFKNAYLHDKDVFSSRQKFNAFFPGIYVTNTFGTGSILNIGRTVIRFYYDHKNTDTTTIVKYGDFLTVTPEIINVNRIVNLNPQYIVNAIENESIDTTYIKAPAGVTTEITFPTGEILSKLRENDLTLQNTVLNAVNLKVPVYEPDDDQYGITYPEYLLFIRKSDMEEFFYKKRKLDGKNVFLAQYNSTNQNYNFGNISNFIINILAQNKDTVINEPDAIALIPVTYSESSTTSQVNHVTKPSLVKLKKGVEMTFVYSKRK